MDYVPVYDVGTGVWCATQAACNVPHADLSPESLVAILPSLGVDAHQLGRKLS